MPQRSCALVRTLRSVGLLLSLLALTTFAFWGCTSGDGEEDLDRPNILLISIDTLRPDHMGAYGYDKPTTPRLDAFAREGVVFQDVFAPRGSTWPSLTSLMTGKFPINHGVYKNGLMLERNQRTLPEILKGYGYHSGAFLSNFYDAPNRGFERKVGENNPMQPHRAWDRKNVDRALEWMAERKDQRTFTWVHLMDPHRPYDPLPEELSKLAGSYSGWLAPFVSLEQLRTLAKEERAPLTLEQIDQFLSLKDIYSGQTRGQLIHSGALRGNVPLDMLMEMITLFELDISEEDLAYIVANYDAQIPPADALLGEVLDKLDELGLKDDTLVIFTTDHGDDLFDHNHYFFHGSSIYDSTLKVAWMMRWPGKIPAGQVVEGPLARNIDILPTILELVGIDPPPSIDGVSAAQMLLGEGSYEPGPAVIEWTDLEPNPPVAIFNLREPGWSFVENRSNAAIATPPYHLEGHQAAYRIGQEELFDMSSDPDQQVNLLSTRTGTNDPESLGPQTLDRVDELLNRLRQKRDLAQRLAAWVSDQSKKPRPKATAANKAVGVTLAQLGYLGGAVKGISQTALSQRVHEMAQELFDSVAPKTARHYALLAEAQWYDGDTAAAKSTLQNGLDANPDDKSLQTLKRQIR